MKLKNLLMAATILGSSVLPSVASADLVGTDSGTKNIQVTYNTTPIDPDPDPTVDSDFVVLIPSGYNLSDTSEIDKGQISMVDKDDFSKAYNGNSKIDIKISSSHNYKFGDAQYSIQNESKSSVENFEMSKEANVKEIDAVLTKKSSSKKKVAMFDNLTFTYNVKTGS